MINIYVGNLPWSTTDAELTDLFSEHGDVQEARIICDRENGQSRGFGFVKMPDRNQAQNAIAALDGTDFGGRTLKVNEAQPRASRGSRR